MLNNLRYLVFPVLHIVGLALTAFAFLMLTPLVFFDTAKNAFETASLITLGVGLLCFFVTRKDKRELLPRDGFLLATLLWFLIAFFASLPLYFALPQLTFTQSFFESISGVTTTCSTVLNHIDELPSSVNFWRCLLAWLGGMGFLVLAVAILPLLGVGGAQLFRAESSGPFKETKLTPRIADTARGLWWIYLVLTFLCFSAYFLAGMTAFDALLHAFSTVSLGGFSTHDTSFAFFDSALVDSIAIFFMIVCGFNFSLHFLAWKRKSLAPYFVDTELRYYVLSVCVISLTVFYLLFDAEVFPTLSQTLRYGLFNTVSVITTSGFSNADYGLWPLGVSALMLCFATFTTCGGSPGGGLKMMRALILLKQLSRGFTQTMHPNAIVPLHVGTRVVSDKLVFIVLNYVLLWVGTAIFAMIVLSLTGLDPLSAISAALGCLTNTGPGLASVGPASTFAHLSSFQLWVCALCMLVGRLELMTVFVLFTRDFWRV